MARSKTKKTDDNVFRDLGFTPEEATSLKIRSDLMITLSEIIKRQKLTQAAAAKIMGVTQPRVSDLVRGKVDLFSIDTLIDMISRAGGTVEVTVRGVKRAA